jgi:hypothetical protein
MPRYRYPQRQDPVEEARKQSAFRSTQQRQAQTSAYAAARFQEWAAGAQEREALMNARLQKAQSEAELAGAQFNYNFWKDNELRRQTTAYYTAMPALQESLKQNGIYPGSQRYAAEMAAFAAEIPDAVTHNEAIRKDLQGYAKVDASQAEITNRLNTVTSALNQAGQRPTSFSTTASGGVDVKATRPMDDAQKDLKDSHGITRTQFETFDPNSAFLGQVDEKGTFTKSNTGSHIQFTALKDGKANPVTMTVPEFNRYKEAFGMQPIQPQALQGTPVTGNTPTLSATPDHQAALDWANANPNDPRAAQILQLNSQ